MPVVCGTICFFLIDFSKNRKFENRFLKIDLKKPEFLKRLIVRNVAAQLSLLKMKSCAYVPFAWRYREQCPLHANCVCQYINQPLGWLPPPPPPLPPGPDPKTPPPRKAAPKKAPPPMPDFKAPPPQPYRDDPLLPPPPPPKPPPPRRPPTP